MRIAVAAAAIGGGVASVCASLHAASRVAIAFALKIRAAAIRIGGACSFA
jgi:hypothetical protein